MKKERRKHARNLSRGCEYQVFSCDPEFVGRLKEISEGGLALQYTPGKNLALMSRYSYITIKGPKQSDISGIACRAKYDISILEENKSFTGAEVRQRGMKFVALTVTQKKKPDLLLKSVHFKRYYRCQEFSGSSTNGVECTNNGQSKG